jgi:hypothetical protein
MASSCQNNRVNWRVPGPLMNSACCCMWNWPMCPVNGGVTYDIEEDGPIKYIIFPIKEIFPGFLFALPPFWIHAAFFACVDAASALVLIHDRERNTLKCELRQKSACAERVEAKRSLVASAVVEIKPGSLLKSKEAK